jgi:prepilin-type N-terminal cleavage/methylation domain-containing protein
MKKYQIGNKGFSLLEMLLVLGIMSAIIVMIANYSTLKTSQLRRDRAAIQMQQILNAGLAYYLNNGKWPNETASTSPPCPTSSDLSTLLGSYLPATFNSPYVGSSYSITCNAYGLFSVSLTTASASDASSLAGLIPLGTVSGAVATGSVNVPGQNLNNARSVNFANYYHNGACVPAPTCPSNMAPDILVVPVSLYGDNTATTYYPLLGFTAYAVSDAAGDTYPVAYNAVVDCATQSSASTCQSNSNGTSVNSNYLYWRVCLSITTVDGVVTDSTNGSWAENTSILAITRCVPVNENYGSDFSVWQ